MPTYDLFTLYFETVCESVSNHYLSDICHGLDSPDLSSVIVHFLNHIVSLLPLYKSNQPYKCNLQLLSFHFSNTLKQLLVSSSYGRLKGKAKQISTQPLT